MNDNTPDNLFEKINSLGTLDIFIISLIIVALIYIYYKYKTLKVSQINFEEAKSGVDVQLKKRYDLIPNILSIAKKYMEHEKDLLTEITSLRAEAIKSNSYEETMKYNEKLTEDMQKLLFSMENYPDLKSNILMGQAIETYNEIEEYISAARRFYNSALNDFKKQSEIFPGNIFANIFNIHVNDKFFEAKDLEKNAINANDYLK